MTRDELLRLEGRELDIALGYALGWRWYSRPYIADPEKRYWIYTDHPLRIDVPEDDPRISGFEHPTGRSGPLALSELPRYSTTWQGTGIIQEAMRVKGWRMGLETFDDFAEAEFCQPGLVASDGSLARDCKSVRAADKNAPRAVALAARLALEGA